MLTCHLQYLLVFYQVIDQTDGSFKVTMLGCLKVWMLSCRM